MDQFFAPLTSPVASLMALAVSAFAAATLLPLASEAVLFGVLSLHPDLFWAALMVATTANTLGGFTTYLIGRFFASRRPLHGLAAMRRWGAPLLLLAWVPLVGDGFVLASGWLQVDWRTALAFQALGRLARYLAIASVA